MNIRDWFSSPKKPLEIKVDPSRDTTLAAERAAHDLLMATKCPVCGHPASEHWEYNSMWYMNAYWIKRKDNGCLCQVWEQAEALGKIYDKTATCPCPLTPQEVTWNASLQRPGPSAVWTAE